VLYILYSAFISDWLDSEA